MKPYIFYILVFLFCGLASCGHDDVPTEVNPYNNDVLFTFTLSAGQHISASRGTEGNDAVEYDAAFDMENLQVALFNDNNSELVQSITELYGYKLSDYSYQYYGVIDRTNVEADQTYRCVILANSDGADFSNSDFDMTNLTYDIDALPNDDASFDNKKIPMWGVSAFTFKTSDDIQNLGELSLIRAAAKCRIHLSDELYAAGYRLDQPTPLTKCNSTGYVVPANFATVSSSSNSAGAKSYSTICEGFYNPYSSERTTTLAFREEPNTANKQSYIVYFPEIDNSIDRQSVTLSITNETEGLTGTYELEMKDYSGNTQLNKFVRNHVYDFEVVSLNSEFNVVLNAGSWDDSTTEIDFTETITVKDDHDWVAGTYSIYDGTTNQVVMLNGVVLQGNFTIITPIGNTWMVTLSDDSGGNSFCFLEPEVDDNGNVQKDNDGNIIFKKDIVYDDDGNAVTQLHTAQVLTGEIGTGNNSVTVYIYALEPTTSQQHTASLDVYVIYGSGKTSKVEELSGWTVIQPI